MGTDLRGVPLGLIFEPEPILQPSETKSFWSDGLTYPSIIGGEMDHAAEMLFTGWTRGPNRSFSNQLGIARRAEDSTEWVIDPEPLFPRWKYGTGSATALDSLGRFIAVTAFEKPEFDSKGFLPRYSVRWAERSGSAGFVMGERISGLPMDPMVSVAKPSFLRIGPYQFAWFSVRQNRAYSILGGIIRDGSFSEIDKLSLKPSGESWESKSVSYLHCWRDSGTIKGVYAGNDYGRAGLGFVSTSVSSLISAVRDLP